MIEPANDQIRKQLIRAGEIYGGGIVFYVEKNGKHGLIASLSDVAKDVPWAGKQKPAMSFPQKAVYVMDKTKRLISSDVDGEYNTKTILECGYMNSAAWYCSDYAVESYHNWYLPALYELEKLIAARPEINKVINNSKITGTEEISDKYWTSTNTEIQPSGTWAYRDGDFRLTDSDDTYFNVRAIRKF